MPAIKVSNQGDSASALSTLKFRDVSAPGALISLFVAGVTVTDTVSLSVENEDYLLNANPNIEASADVVDTDRDQILFQEGVTFGEIFLAVDVTTALNFLITIDPHPASV